MARDVIINEDDLNEIMTTLGFPIIDFEVFPYTEKQVKDLFIYPALRDYFRYFPKLNIQEYVVDNNFNIDFPNDNTFTAKDVIMNTNQVSSGSITGEPFVDASSVLSLGSRYGGKYGTRYSYYIPTTYHTRRADYQGLKNTQKAFRFNIDRSNRIVKGYSNIAGRMTINWCEMSIDFSDVVFDKVSDVMDLSRAYIYKAWSKLVNMQSTELSNELDGDFMQQEYEDLRDAVFERWNGLTKPVLIRGA